MDEWIQFVLLEDLFEVSIIKTQDGKGGFYSYAYWQVNYLDDANKGKTMPMFHR
jgi:hypothetical protein